MKKKGLCSSCIYDEECSFSRIFPVLQCAEFTGYKPRLKKAKVVKREKMEFDEEPTTIWE